MISNKFSFELKYFKWSKTISGLSVLIAACLSFFYFGPSIIGSNYIINPKSIRPDNGDAYYLNFSKLNYSDADGILSPLQIFENETILDKPHAIHNDIRFKGQGRFSHWRNGVYFSATDNSDPRINNRVYRIHIPWKPSGWILLIAITICFIINVKFIWAKKSAFKTIWWNYLYKSLLYINALLATAFFIIGLILFYFNIAGFVYKPDLISKFQVRKDDSTWTYAETLKHIDTAREQYAMRQIDDSQFFFEMTKAINLRMINPIKNSILEKNAMVVSPYENWLLYLLWKFKPMISRYQLYRFVDPYKSLERGLGYRFADPYKSIERGLGMCKRQATTLLKLLKEDGFNDVKLWSPGGLHVVAIVNINNQFYTLDPDYGVLIVGHPESFVGKNNIVENAYSNALQKPITHNLMSFFHKIYRDNGVNVEFEDEEHILHKKTESIIYYLKWFLPILLLIIGVILISRIRKILRMSLQCCV